MSKAEIEKLLNQLPLEKAEAAKMKAERMNWSPEQQLPYLEKKLRWQDLEETTTPEVNKPVDAEKIAAELRKIKPHPEGGMSRSSRARRCGPLHGG